MTDLRQAAQQALEALGSSLYPQPRQMAAIAALKAALAEPVQEPFCYVYEYDSPLGLHREFYPREYNGMKPSRTVPLYTAPPQRKPLTEEEIIDLWAGVSDPESPDISMVDFARAIERAYGITS